MPGLWRSVCPGLGRRRARLPALVAADRSWTGCPSSASRARSRRRSHRVRPGSAQSSPAAGLTVSEPPGDTTWTAPLIESATTPGAMTSRTSPPAVSNTAASRGLPTRRLTRSRDCPVDRPRPRYGEVGVSRPASVLQRRRHPGADDPQHPVLGGLRSIFRSGRPAVRISHRRPPRKGLDGPQADGRAWRDQRRRVGAEVPQRGIGVPQHVPPSRRRRRIHRRVGPGDRHRAGRHRRPWCRPARQPEPFIETREVGEARREPTEVAAVLRIRVPVDRRASIDSPVAAATSERSSPS